MQLIEADLQLIIRIIVNTQNKNIIELDNQISKYNYSLRMYHLIESTILKKRLVYNNSMLNGNIMIHNMTDLKSSYDRQLT